MMEGKALPAAVLLDLRELARKYPGFAFSVGVTPAAAREMAALANGDPSDEAKGFLWLIRDCETDARFADLGCVYPPGGVRPEGAP